MCCAVGVSFDLADRIAYFSSDVDLDDGDVPVTLESALGFLAFFGAVESEGHDRIRLFVGRLDLR